MNTDVLRLVAVCSIAVLVGLGIGIMPRWALVSLDGIALSNGSATKTTSSLVGVSVGVVRTAHSLAKTVERAGRGLEIGNVHYEWINLTALIEIKGYIQNPSSVSKSVPLLIVTLFDGMGNIVFSQEISSGISMIEASGVKPFSIRVPNNPSAQELEVRLQSIGE